MKIGRKNMTSMRRHVLLNRQYPTACPAMFHLSLKKNATQNRQKTARKKLKERKNLAASPEGLVCDVVC